MCGPHRKRPAAEEEDSDAVQASNDVDPSSAYAGTLQSLRGRVAGPLLGPLQASVPIPVWTGLRPSSAQPTDVAEGRVKKKRGTAIARKPEAKDAPQATAAAPAPAAEPKAKGKPATQNASVGGFSLTPSIRSPKTGGFAPASAETKPIMVPERGAKPEKAAAKPAAAKPKAKATAAKPDTASAKP
jgi:D-alanyl-D-alanine carboxypeptidase